MNSEILDIIDENNNVIGQSSRDNAHKKGLKHRISATLLIDSNNKFMIPTASENSDYAGLFHSTAGHVLSGENYETTIKRELEEETAISTKNIQLEKLGTYWFEMDSSEKKVSERFEVFLAKYDPSMGKIVLNDEQVDEQWLSLEELKYILQNTPEKLSKQLKMTLEKLL